MRPWKHPALHHAVTSLTLVLACLLFCSPVPGRCGVFVEEPQSESPEECGQKADPAESPFSEGLSPVWWAQAQQEFGDSRYMERWRASAIATSRQASDRAQGARRCFTTGRPRFAPRGDDPHIGQVIRHRSPALESPQSSPPDSFHPLLFPLSRGLEIPWPPGHLGSSVWFHEICTKLKVQAAHRRTP